MKKPKLIITIFLFLTTFLTKAQFTFTVTPPTCSTCCDAFISVTQTLCPQGAALGGFSPSLTLLTFAGNTFVYAGACCGTYTMYMISPWKECTPGPYVGSVSVCSLPTNISVSKIYLDEMRIYPNPTTGKCYTDLKGNKTAVVASPDGAIARTFRNFENEIDLFGLPLGIYFISIYSDKNILITRQKIILD